MQQIQTALGKNQRRVRTALLSEQTSPEFTEPGIPWLQLQQPVAPDAELAQQIKADTGQPIIWIVDPQNNLVMHYSADQLPKEILTDLKRLLKLSLIG